jgi:TRAP-type C4-dicarboxylate transport system permease small subunit
MDELPREGERMLRIVGIVLIVAGLAGLAVGGFEYTRTKEVAKVGPLEVKAKEQRSVTIPPLAAGGAAAVGVALFLAGRRK